MQSILALIIMSIFTTNCLACSAFLLKSKDYSLIGFNENWISMPGMVVINKRGVLKQNLSWNHLVSKDKISEPQAKWISKYGSVSFNLLGLDLPCYGLNEKGLFVVELGLKETYSLPDKEKPKMFWAQWIQYQLDNYASVEEVVMNLKHSPIIDWWPTFDGSHFFICDKRGHTAALELINGRFEVSSGKNMPIPVLCNNPYQSEIKKMKTFIPFGGNKNLSMDSKNNNNRFSKAAYYISHYNSCIEKNPVNYAFSVLDSIWAGKWQFVADIKNNIIYFRTDIAHSIKSIDMSACDFSKNTPIEYLDINCEKKDNVTNFFIPLSIALNDNYIKKGFPIGYPNKDFFQTDSYTYLKKHLHYYSIKKLNTKH